MSATKHGKSSDFTRRDISELFNQIDTMEKSSDRAALELVRSGIDAVDNDGNTGLMLAFNYGVYDTAEWILDQGADPDKQNNKGETALIILTMHEREHGSLGVKMLLDKNANPHKRDKNYATARWYASRTGQGDQARLSAELLYNAEKAMPIPEADIPRGICAYIKDMCLEQ